MKIISARRSDSLQQRHRFLAEVRITDALRGIGVPTVHGMGVCADGRFYFTMDEVEGWTLQVLIEASQSSHLRCALPGMCRRSEPLAIFRKACEVVGRAHRRGIVHRDLKPANMMATVSGEAVVLDWGLARRVGPSGGRFSATVTGTPAYMAPEQARGESVLDTRSDVYALGAVLYHVLTGRRPFEGSPSDVLEHIASGEPPPPLNGVGSSLATICETAMATDPAVRFSSAGALVEALRDHPAPVMVPAVPWGPSRAPRSTAAPSQEAPGPHRAGRTRCIPAPPPATRCLRSPAYAEPR